MSDEMPAKGDDFRIVIRSVPSLSHMAQLKLAVPLFLGFGMETLDKVFAEIQHRNPTASGEYNEDYIPLKSNRLKERLFFIPGHLRKGVQDAIKGLHEEFLKCRREHPYIGADKCSLHLRPDGTIDRKKIARQLVADVGIDIRKRFHIACTYNFKRKIRTLWALMEASGRTENFDTADLPFWFKMRDGSMVPWVQVPPPRGYPPIWYPRFSAFLEVLQSEDRQRFLSHLRFATDDDFRFCLYSLTKEEEDEILKTHAQRILRLHLNWPMQSLFLETADKMWNFIGAKCFRFFLKLLLDMKDHKEDFDYGGLFKEFYYRSPHHLKESVKVDRYLSMRINLYLNGMSRKRKADEDAQKYSKKKIKS